MHCGQMVPGGHDGVNFEIVSVESISAIPPGQWDALIRGNPLLSHAYLEALESTQCAVPRTGWHPRHLALMRTGSIRAVMFLYAKTHSRGEYVFDQAWAHAYARYGMKYYPKLVSAIPFTPVPGPRLLAHDRNDQRILLEAAKHLVNQEGHSSVHILFPDEDTVALLRSCGFLIRSNIQFHWRNAGYRRLDDFLATLTQP